MGHNESSAKKKTHSSECLQKETGESIHQQLNSSSKSTRSKRSKYIQEEQKAGNNLSAEINEVETKRTIQRINKTKSWFFEKINKIDKLLAKLTKGHGDSVQINKIRNEKGNITKETEEIQSIIRSCYKSLYSTRLENLDEMGDFLMQ